MSSITTWNRVEPRCRAAGLEPGLQARAHDPLWLLARQWQVGEFTGRDAGSPISAKIQSTSAAFDRFKIGDQSEQPYDNQIPIEVLIEREKIRPSHSTDDLRQATEAGLHFLRLLDVAQLSSLRVSYLTQYPLVGRSTEDADSQCFSSIVSGRVIDGIGLYADLIHAGTQLPAAPAIPDPDRDAVLRITREWIAWYKSLFAEPGGADSWLPERMEYQFAIGSAGNPGSLQAQEYDGGAVEWYTFDRSTSGLASGSAQPVTAPREGLISPVTFRGMPARRFWEMEDASVDIGALSAGAEDLGRLLLREFALIYGNDWFQIPLVVPIGCEVTIDSLEITDTFGLKETIPHYSQVDGTSGQWRLFALSNETASTNSAPAPNLVVVPSAVGAQDGVAIEDVLLLRDELADMAWGIERSALGSAGLLLDRPLIWKVSAPPIKPPSPNQAPKYRLGSTVPDYWIPFLPIGISTGHLQLRRGILPTSSSGPLGRLLSAPGLTIFLEEIPREGVHLERRYRYARGVDGSAWLWIGRLRSTGRGEGRSGLRFDYLEM